MNLKKIIREEVDGFNWISDYEFDIDKVKVGDVFKTIGGYTWFEVDKIRWNETIPELSIVYIKDCNGEWENEFYIKDIIKGLNKSDLEKVENKQIKESDDFDWIKDRAQPSEGVVKLIIHLPNMFLEYDVDFKNVEQFLSLVQDYAIEAVEGYMMPIDRIVLNGWVVLNRYPSETKELKDGLSKLKKKVNSYL